MKKITIINLIFILFFSIIGTSLAASTVNLPVTGQTTLYTSGDDGDIQAGQVWPVPRFVDNGDGTVTDKLTGLMWLKDASCLGSQTWANALTKVEALNAKSVTCGSYTANYTDWRLPNINELESLVNAQQSNSASWLNSQGFSGVQSYLYWSSSSGVSGTSDAWVVSFYVGGVYWLDKTLSYYVLPVRGGQSGSFGNSVIWKTGQTISYASGDDGSKQTGAAWSSPRFTDNGNGTITDNNTGLIWLKNVNCFGAKTWAAALSSCSSLASGSCGLTDGSAAGDWRLPNRKELRSLTDYSKYSPSIPQGNPFSGVQSRYYWSSSTGASDTSYAWIVYFFDGGVHSDDKTYSYYVLPVRGGQFRSFDHSIISTAISPQAAIAAGAQFRVDGGAWQNSGASVSPLSSGAHTIEFKSVSGYTTPDSQIVTTQKNQTAAPTGTYISNTTTTTTTVPPTTTTTTTTTTTSTTTTTIPIISPKYLKIRGANAMASGSSQTITITAYDEYNNVATNYARDKTLTFSGANAISSIAPTCTDNNNATVSFGTGTVITFSSGSATTVMKLYKAEAATIAVTDGTISTTDDAYKLSVNVSGGAKSKLLWAVQPASPVSVGVTWQPFSIEITDDYGNRTTNTDLIQILPSEGLFSGTTTKQAVSGLATFNNIKYNTSAAIVVYGQSGALTATDASNSVSVVDATTGAISITLSPQGAIDAGAKWRVNGGVWQDSGGVVSSLTAANYIVDFKDVTGWVKPNNLTLTVESGKTNSQNVNYNSTPVTKPVPTVGPAMDVTYNSARLTGNIMPNGGVTTYYFSYGISIYDNKTETVNIGSGTTAVVIEKTINNLSPNTKYYFQIFAENSAGTIYSSDNSFTTKSAPASNMKAIIVAGGHSKEEGNNIWDSTLTCANIAYKALIYQGIEKSKIRYLCQTTTIDADGNGQIDDVYNIATNDNLYDAIVNWAVLDTKDLVLYLVDHGGPKTFLMRKGEDLHAEQLKSWLDSLQQTITGKVVVIYDACYSGSFVSVLKPPAGKERIIITSTSEESTDESAIFLNSAMSFSYLFWTRIENNFNFCDAYLGSKNDISMMFSNQLPMIDANGDGISNKYDHEIARNFQIGIGKGTASPPPEIGGPISEPKIITVNENSALIYAENITSPEGILRVWAVVTPPNCTSGSTGTPLTDLPEFNLKNLTGTNRYEAAYNGFTKPGTYNITIFANDQKGFISQPKSTKVQVGAAIGATSFDGDGKTDLLWRNNGNGKVAIWLMNGTAISSYDITGAVEDLNWEIINTGDFNGDGKSDLLWRNKANGKAAIWLMNGTAIQSDAIIGAVEDLNWEIINVGDFNGDGKTDLLWKHKTSGKVAVWLMNGTAISSYDITGEVSDLNWEIINVGDFNGDGKSDFLWRNKANGKVAVWLMNGTAISSYDITGAVEDLNWEIINVGDFNGDGKSDFLWRNKANGKVAVWLMNGTAISSYDITGEVSDLNWEIINVGDFNGDGKSDFLWRNKANGKVAIWLINGTAISSYDITGEVSDLNWEIINVGDFNGDGKTDFLWRNKANGKIAVWLINGTAIQSYDITGEVSDLNWGINNKKKVALKL